METEYFRDIESDAIYAGVGPMAVKGLFRMCDPQAGEWEFLIPESPDWDALHQRIYRNFRVQRINPEELAHRMPPLPDAPAGPFRSWAEYFVPKKPIKGSKYPGIAKLVSSLRDASLSVCVVLFEDRYETAFGDGEFHYIHDVFLTPEEAQACVEGNKEEWTHFHLRTVTMQLARGEFEFPDFQPERYDRFEPSEVLDKLEARLTS